MGAEGSTSCLPANHQDNHAATVWRFARDTTKWIEVTSQKPVSSTAAASAQFAGRAVQLSRNVRQSDHIFVNEIAGHKVKRGARAGEEWLAATKHDGVDVESILVNQTQVR